MSWPLVKEIQSWQNICEKLLGIKFNNGKEITSYPITEREHLADASNQYTLANYDKNPCKNAPNKSLSFRTCSFGELVVIIYHILIKEFADKLFNEENLRAFFDRVNSAVGAWRSVRAKNDPDSKALAMVISILKIRLTKEFYQAGSLPELYDNSFHPRLALGLQDFMLNDLAQVPVNNYNTTTTFDSVLTSQKKQILDIVKTVPAPDTPFYNHFGVKGMLNAQLQSFVQRDSEQLLSETRSGAETAVGFNAILQKTRNLFETNLEDYVNFEFKNITATFRVIAYLNTDRGRRLVRTVKHGAYDIAIIPVKVTIDWEKLKKDLPRIEQK